MLLSLWTWIDAKGPGSCRREGPPIKQVRRGCLEVCTGVHRFFGAAACPVRSRCTQRCKTRFAPVCTGVLGARACELVQTAVQTRFAPVLGCNGVRNSELVQTAVQSRFAPVCTGFGVLRRACFGAGANRGANTICTTLHQPAPCCTGANRWTPYSAVCTGVCTAVCTRLFVVLRSLGPFGPLREKHCLLVTLV